MERDWRDRAYRFYVTDALKAIGSLNIRYADIVNPVKETRSAGEIINNLKDKLDKIGGS